MKIVGKASAKEDIVGGWLVGVQISFQVPNLGHHWTCAEQIINHSLEISLTVVDPGLDLPSTDISVVSWKLQGRCYQHITSKRSVGRRPLQADPSSRVAESNCPHPNDV